MKALIVLLAVLAGIWIWRSSRRLPPERKQPGGNQGRAKAAIDDMVSCPVCGVHLPRADAVQGKRALYCSQDHRHQAED